MTIKVCDILTERTVYLEDHEVLLSFYDGCDAENFIDWWHCTGHAQFAEFINELWEKEEEENGKDNG